MNNQDDEDSVEYPPRGTDPTVLGSIAMIALCLFVIYILFG